MWMQIYDTCTPSFGMSHSKETLRSKWATMKRELHVWIKVRGRSECKAGTVNFSEEKRIKMTQSCFDAQKAANTQTDRGYHRDLSSILPPRNFF